MKSLKNKVLASALALTLVGGAFISKPKKAEAIGGKELKIKKVLNLPDRVNTPAETLKFTFTKQSVNGKEDVESKKLAPDISGVTIGYTAGDNKDADSVKACKQVVKVTDNILNGVTFTKEGQYTYIVTETKGDTGEMTYSQAEYKVSIFVGRNEDNLLEVTDIQIVKTKKDSGEETTGSNKESYKPGTGGESDPSYKDNNFAFENTYNKKDGNNDPSGTINENGNIPEVDTKAFALIKNVMGEEASINKNQAFGFTIKAEKPKVSTSTDKTFTYKIVDAKGEASSPTTVEYDKDFTVNLKHGERIVFGQILLGSKVTVVESDDAGYTPKVNDKSTLAGQNNVTVEALKSGLVIGDEGVNAVYFENTQQTPTGILIDNLPFIALVLVAGTGIFFFVKNRKEEEALA